MDFMKDDTLDEIKIVQKKAEEMMREFFSDDIPRRSIEYLCWTPSVDIYETDSEIVIIAELAGVRKEDVSVMLDRDTVCIMGQRLPYDSKGKIRHHRMEIAFGPFKRVFRISVPIRCEEVEASFQDGFLSVRMPKQVPVSVKINVDK